MEGRPKRVTCRRSPPGFIKGKCVAFVSGTVRVAPSTADGSCTDGMVAPSTAGVSCCDGMVAPSTAGVSCFDGMVAPSTAGVSCTDGMVAVVEEVVSRSEVVEEVVSRSDPQSCMCAEKQQVAVVSGTNVRVGPSTADVSCTGGMVAPSTPDASIACSVVAALKHVTSPVCTWKGRDVDNICSEGTKVASFVAKSNRSSGFENELCEFFKQHSVFGQKWDVGIGPSVYGGFGLDESALLEKVQEHLESDGMCLLNLHSAFSAIIQHKNYIVMVDCGTRDASGLASNTGRSVAVFNTSVLDLMYHISDLRRSLGAEWYAVSSLSVKAGLVDPDIDSATLLVDVDVTVASPAVVEGGSSQSNVRGSFHQGDRRRFQHAGAQCMAISLVALAKHSIDGVFSWQTDNLDKVVVSGDKLYNEVTADSNVNREQSKHLCVLDLPRKSVIDGQTFDFEYGEYVSGDIDVVTGDMIDSGLTTSLRSGLIKMFGKYHTCLLTVCDTTCALGVGRFTKSTVRFGSRFCGHGFRFGSVYVDC